jgi:hypothetical protein
LEKKLAALRLSAELKAGVLLKALQKAKGARGQLNGRDPSGARRLRGPDRGFEPAAKTLEQMGVSATQSSRWQQLAENPKAAPAALEDGKWERDAEEMKRHVTFEIATPSV